MDRTKRDSVGKISTDLLTKASDNTHTPEDQMREQLGEYDYNIYICIEEGKKRFQKDFYVVVLTKKERLMQNVIRNYFFNRISCPTPEYDQAVYKYNNKTEIIDFLWVIPAKDICEYMQSNALLIDPTEKDLLKFVMDFNDGTLLKLCKKLNEETEYTGQLLLNV